jgi:hypothetical protein
MGFAGSPTGGQFERYDMLQPWFMLQFFIAVLVAFRVRVVLILDIDIDSQAARTA